MKAEIQAVANELIGALLAGGAQGVLIVALVWGALKVFRRANAATRHAVWFATLLIVATLPAATFLRPYAPQALGWLQSFRTPEVLAEPNVQLAAHEIDLTPAPEIEAHEAEAAPVFESAFDEEMVAPAEVEVAVNIPAPAPVWSLIIPKMVAIAFIGFWAALALIRLGALAGQLVVLWNFKRHASSASLEHESLFEAVRLSMSIQRNPRLLVSDEIAAPMAAGFFRPAVLMPSLIMEQTTDSQLEHIFRHELAHIARRDDWANLVQQALAALFFFHPGVRFVSRRLSAEREIACDDYALAGSPAPREYALLLTEFASRMKGRDFTAAPAAWSSHSQLKERIGMILDMKRNASPRVSRTGASAIAAATIAAALAVMISAPRIVLAEEAPAEQTSTIVSTTKSGDTVTTIETTVTDDADDVDAPDRKKRRVVVRAVPAPVSAVAAVPSVPPVPPVVTVSPVEVVVKPTPPGWGGPNAFAIAPKSPDAPKMKFYAQADSEDAGPGKRPRAVYRIERDSNDSDLERRLERLERMVESLAGREKGDPLAKRSVDSTRSSSSARSQNFNWDSQVKGDLERAQRDAERAHRDAERAMKEVDVDGISRKAMEDAKRGMERAKRDMQLHQEEMQLAHGHESLKARRKALEEHRKQLDRELASLEKEMAEEERDREKEKAEREREKADKERQKADKERAKADREREKAEQERKAEKVEKLEKLEKLDKLEKDDVKRRDTGDAKPEPEGLKKQ